MASRSYDRREPDLSGVGKPIVIVRKGVMMYGVPVPAQAELLDLRCV